MQLPAILSGESRTRLIQGAVAGLVATVAIGFAFGGWYTGGQARTLANKTASAEVVKVLTPICVDTFMRSPDSAAQLTALKAASSYNRDSLVREKVKIPGLNSIDYATAEACAKALNENPGKVAEAPAKG